MAPKAPAADTRRKFLLECVVFMGAVNLVYISRVYYLLIPKYNPFT